MDNAENDDILKEFNKKEKIKIDLWRQSSQEFYKGRIKVEKGALWNPESDRLPNSTEISSNRGWPTESEERKMKELFIDSFRDKVNGKLGEENQNKAEEVLGFLYGVYLINYITGGLIINKHFDYPSFCKWENGQWQKKTENLDPNNLDDWPININLSDKRSHSEFNDVFGPSILINVATAGYSGQNPNEESLVEKGESVDIVKSWGGLRTREKKTPTISYKMSKNNIAVLAGIEEGHHSLIHHLKNVQGIGVDTSPPLVEPGQKPLNSVPNDWLNFELLYHGAITQEFTASLAKATYVRRYLPEAWTEGYSKYVQVIREKRRELKTSH